ARTPASINSQYGPLQAIPAWQLQTEDEKLYMALALAYSYNPAWRDQVASKLLTKGSTLTWSQLPEGTAGLTIRDFNRLVINLSEQQESIGVLSTTVTHETLHAIWDPAQTTNAEQCYLEEATAFSLEVQTWLNLPPALRSQSAEAQFEDRLSTVWQ